MKTSICLISGKNTFYNPKTIRLLQNKKSTYSISSTAEMVSTTLKYWLSNVVASQWTSVNTLSRQRFINRPYQHRHLNKYTAIMRMFCRHARQLFWSNKSDGNSGMLNDSFERFWNLKQYRWMSILATYYAGGTPRFKSI